MNDNPTPLPTTHTHITTYIDVFV